MGFVNLYGLFALIGVPIILILYMLRPKNAPHTLPSLYLWKAMVNEIESASRFQKFKSSLLMFLQILLILLLTLMLAGLFRRSGTLPEQVILVVDCSVSMQATDVTPSRMEAAKEQAIAYVDQLEKDAQVTLIALKDIPEILLTAQTDHGLISAAIKELQATDTYGDINLALQTTNALKKEADMPIVYFGDRTYPGADNLIVVKSDDNVGVNGVTYSLYEKEGVMGVLADLTNDGSTKVTVPISLYGDDQLLDAKQVEIEPMTGGKIFFDNVPLQTKQLKVVIDRPDILKVDNTAYAVIAPTKVKKAVLVTKSNIFLEKVLKLDSGLELYLAEEKDMNTLKGFDLYIYDSVLPTILPKDGSLLLFNPPDNANFKRLGYAKNSEIFTAGHAITNHLEKPDFAVGVTQVYELPTWAEDVLDTEYGVCAFAGNLDGVRMVVFGFDLHNTDLPLVVDFPIMMSNVTDYLVPNSLLQATSISAGQAMAVRIGPSTQEAYIVSPDATKEYLDISQEDALYKNTYMAGIYTLVQKVPGGELTEQFGVNVPRPEKVLVNENAQESEVHGAINRKSLSIQLGCLALIVLLTEWFIYLYRRKIHAIKL